MINTIMVIDHDGALRVALYVLVKIAYAFFFLTVDFIFILPIYKILFRGNNKKVANSNIPLLNVGNVFSFAK